jgi:hypothetical protein
MGLVVAQKTTEAMQQMLFVNELLRLFFDLLLIAVPIVLSILVD